MTVVSKVLHFTGAGHTVADSKDIGPGVLRRETIRVERSKALFRTESVTDVAE